MTSRLLASIFFGLIITPLLFIAQGVLSGFGWQFSALALPLVTLSITYLFITCILARPILRFHLLGRAVTFLSWVVLVLFVGIVSGVNLMTAAEQLGIVSATCLVGIAFAFCFSFFWPTPLEVKLGKNCPLPLVFGFAVSLACLACFALAWWFSQPDFIGQVK